jgi:hypothetical protein
MNMPVNQWGGMDYSQPFEIPGFGYQQPSMDGGIFGGAGANYLGSGVASPVTNAGTGLNGWFQNNQSMVQGIGQGLGAFTSLANLYGMFKNLSFQKKAFKFAQEGTKRNFNASAKAFNNEIDDQLTHRTAMANLNNRAAPDTGIFSQRKIAEWG